MAVELATAYVSIVPSMRGVAGQIRDGVEPAAQQEGERAGSTLGGAMAGAATKVAKTGALAVGAAFAGSIVKGFQRLQAIDDARFKLQGLGHDADTVETIMGSAMDAVVGTAFGFGDAASIAASAVAAGVKPGEDLTRTLSLTGDAATIAGTSLGDMGAVFGKIGASNRMMTEEMNQLQDRGLPVLSWLQDEYDITAVAAREMVAKGEVDFATFQRLIENNIGGAALTAGESFRGSLANMGAAVGRFGAALLGPAFERAPAVFAAITAKIDGVTNAVGPVMSAVSGWLSSFSGDLNSTGGVMSGWWSTAKTVFAGVRTVIETVFTWARGFWNRWGADITAFTTETFGGVRDIISQVVEVVRLVVDHHLTQIRQFWDRWGADILRIGGVVMDRLSAIFRNVWGAIKSTVTGAVQIISGVLDVLLGIMTLDFPRVLDGLGSVFAGAWRMIRGSVESIVNNITAVFGGLVDSIGQVGVDIVEGLWSGINSMGDWLASKVSSFVTNRIPDPIARALGISSPSTVAAALTREVPRGMIVGMEAEAKSLQAMSERLAMAALPDLGVPAISGPFAAPPASAPASGRGAGDTFHIDAPRNADERAIARAIADDQWLRQRS